ncbi:ABC-2 transporter permease [Paenibacillus sp. FSL R7-0189]|uniref:ABC-2 transporter permease n=1 Tax=Paenibacillus sp. FSL R7-0189 TaxID=2921673 RepID=UPI0030D94637
MFNLFLLIRKDFILLRNFIPIFLLSILFIAYVQLDNSSMFATFQSLLLLVYSCSMDAQNNNTKFVIGLPVRRQEIILAKYLSLVPYCFIGLVCSLALLLISFSFGYSISPFYWIGVSLTLLLIPLTASIYLPIHYWLGSKNYYFNILFNVVITITTLNTGSSLSNSSFFLTITHLKLQDHLVPIGLTGIVYLFILYCSYRISLRLFSKEEL